MEKYEVVVSSDSVLIDVLLDLDENNVKKYFKPIEDRNKFLLVLRFDKGKRLIDTYSIETKQVEKDDDFTMDIRNNKGLLRLVK